MVDDEETPWRRPLLVGVGALLGVAVLVGGVIGIVTIGAEHLGTR
jgi:ABC-type cobalamin transport system permease subunit